MNSFVLVLGGEIFASLITCLVMQLAKASVEVVESVDGLAEVLCQRSPDLIVVQATRPQAWTVSQHCQETRGYPKIYCLMVDDGQVPGETSELKTEPLDIALAQIRVMTRALENGADAYLWIPPSLFKRGKHIGGDDYLQLLKAHLRTGLAQSQFYRELSRVNDLLSAIALSDPLTQLGNRRAFDWELPRQIQLAQEQQGQLCLLMLDIDHFKAINDSHGHLIGDQVLKNIAGRMRNNMRSHETPFRYGGEEFAIILNNTSPEEALLIAQRLCRLIGEHPVSLDSSLQPLSVTVSIGIAELQMTDNANGLDLIERADQNMLQAKREGRNRVVSA